MNNSIRGIVIDAGHGGEDPGANGNGIIEKEYTLKISKYMYDRFKELGIPVIMTRDSDITLTPTERVNRVKKAFGEYKDVLVISNHINAGGSDISNYEGLNLKKIIYHNIFYIFFHCHMGMVHSCQLFFLAILSFFFLILNVWQLLQFLNR